MHYLLSPLRVEAAHWATSTRTSLRASGPYADCFVVERCAEPRLGSVCRQIVVCDVCRDAHVMPATGYSCTFCPTPCQRCRAGGNGPYCERTPCSCDCHGMRRLDWFGPTVHGGEKMHACEGQCGTVVVFGEQRMCDACSEGARILQALKKARDGAADGERVAVTKFLHARMVVLEREAGASEYPVTRARGFGAAGELGKLIEQIAAGEHHKEKI